MFYKFVKANISFKQLHTFINENKLQIPGYQQVQVGSNWGVNALRVMSFFQVSDLE